MRPPRGTSPTKGLPAPAIAAPRPPSRPATPMTEDPAPAETFLNEVDSAIVIWNASTQFADGGEFGFGAEIGIATGKLHARGPVGPGQLTTSQSAARGD